MTGIAPTSLSPHYYRDNFLRLCNSVEKQYGDILSESELEYLSTVRRANFEAQCLYIRLVSRTGPWFRESLLNYPELNNITVALNDLLDSGLIVCAQALSVEDAAKLFTLAELRTGFAEQLDALRGQQQSPPSGVLRKAALVSQLDELNLSAEEIATALRACDQSRWVAPVAQEQVTLLQLLFFGNRYQSLTDFILQDIGVVSYYPYALSRDRRLFPNRAALQEHLECLALTDEFYALLDSDDSEGLRELAARVGKKNVVHLSTHKRWSTLCNRLARELERRDSASLALGLYQSSYHHPARERSARILEQQGELTKAQQLCEEILAAPWCESEVDSATRISRRLQRKLGGKRCAHTVDQFVELHLQLEPPSGEHAAEHSVEYRVAEHLAPQWQSVRVVENRLMNTLFALAFWEQIFAPVPGAFSHPYQAIPHDMYSPDFYQRRKAMIEQRIEELAHGDLRAELTQAYRHYHSYQCRWLHARAVDAQLVDHACAVIPVTDLITIWRRMLFDPKENRRGFPDLLALGDAPGDYRMIEVKGPGDRLQDHQKRWFRFFQRNNIPAQLAWVEWLAAIDD